MIRASIIIPTFNRPSYLRRILGYYAEGGGSEFMIIVADSSSDENKARNGEIVAAFPNSKILYLGSYPENINPLHKFADALNHVQSKYCIFCADDDFVTPSGISESVDFLENNPDFTVAHGYYISFRLEKTRGKKERFCWGPTYYSQKSITFSDPESRLSHHLSDYFIPTFYAVHRTDILKLSYEEAVKFTSDYHFGELLPSMLTLIYGKMKCLDMLYSARDASSARTVYSRPLKDYTAAKYNEEYAKFRDCLAMHLTKKSQLDIKASKKVIDDAMSAYMKKYYYGRKWALISKIEAVLHHLPHWLFEFIRTLYRKLFLSGRTSTSSTYMNIPPSEYCDDLNKIRLHVLSWTASL